MGYSLNLVVSSAVDAEQKGRIIAASLARWPHIALPAADVVERFKREGLPVQHFLENHALFGADAEPEIEDALTQWSRQFPDVAFAFIQLECFGGDCEHAGYVCQNDKVLVREGFEEEANHRQLLRYVGINLEDEYFAPFVRGYFPEPDHSAEHQGGDAAPPALSSPSSLL